MMKTSIKSCMAAGLLAIAAWPAAAQVTTIQGQLLPGVYGRVDIGNAPPPPLIYAQPIIIQRGPTYVQQAPLYLHVPPGHEKKWSKHCSKYNACGQPVYFVRDGGGDGYRSGDGYRGDNDDHGGKDKHKYKDKDKHNGKGRGKGDNDD